MKTQKWTDERTAQLVSIFAEGTFVTQAAAAETALEMETTTRSITSKLRKLGYDVQLASDVAKESSFSEDATAKLLSILEGNPGEFTFAEIAEQVGGVSAKQVQGKVLSLELTDAVKPTPKAESVKTYSDDEEATFIAMVNEGAFIEDLADALGRKANSIRGKALSLLRGGVIAAIPKQRESTAVNKEDAFEALGDVSAMTVEEIATALGKTARGIKTMLTRRGVTAADYDGAAKAEKLALVEEA